MFENIKKKLEQQHKDSDPKNMSLDFKLMFVYHIVMMVLFAFNPIAEPIHQVYLAAALLGVLVLISAAHKRKSNWSWPGITLSSIPSLALNLVFIYAFLAFSAYMITSHGELPELTPSNIEDLAMRSWGIMLKAASMQAVTPWFLGCIGMAFMSSMGSLNLTTLSKSEFESQCSNN